MSTSPRPYRVAHWRGDGALVLDFGAHAGEALSNVPDSYLTWIVGAGRVFLPRELLDATVDELQQRSAQTPASAGRFDGLYLPDIRRGLDVDGWIATASAGDLTEASAYLHDVLSLLEDRLTKREDATLDGLLAGIIGDEGCNE